MIDSSTVHQPKDATSKDPRETEFVLDNVRRRLRSVVNIWKEEGEEVKDFVKFLPDKLSDKLSPLGFLNGSLIALQDFKKENPSITRLTANELMTIIPDIAVMAFGNEFGSLVSNIFERALHNSSFTERI